MSQPKTESIAQALLVRLTFTGQSGRVYTAIRPTQKQWMDNPFANQQIIIMFTSQKAPSPYPEIGTADWVIDVALHCPVDPAPETPEPLDAIMNIAATDIIAQIMTDSTFGQLCHKFEPLAIDHFPEPDICGVQLTMQLTYRTNAADMTL